jgi:hypothetical protein
LSVSSKRGTPSNEGGFIIAEDMRIQELQALGFPYKCLGIILGCFRRHFSEGFICIEIGTISQEEGVPFLGGWLDPRV